MELQTACEIIGVQDDCTLEELDKRYSILIKRERSSTQLEQIHQAYQVIYTHLLQEDDDTEKPFRKKVDNFFYHYKTFVIFGLFALVLAGSFLYTVIDGQIQKKIEANKPPASLEIMVFGEFWDDDEVLSLLDTRIKGLFPDWESIDIELLYAPADENSQMNMAAMQKNQVIIATSKPDIYIFDARYYEMFIESGPFLALDQLEDMITNESVRTEDLKFYRQEEEDREHLYGIDLGDNELFKDLTIQKESKIAVIRTNTPNQDNAFSFLLKVLE